ncbi:uncharacterized protein MEPE_04713 [Melanopsichium pennsylvanicum]|uniref:Uncharacterized protein n=1 Tax=Melanopsichium pennsylvanicum TaxID=63383 RepID=A0AAJ4XN74_9BASI|nr:uncharacterized protein MEPE_04713 [Melanopsichium pennsylvanicum]
MIKQAAPQHPQGLTKLQHRLLYESDSDSSFDFTFSSPSSIGSNSEYSDVGYQSSSRSRTSSHGASRRPGGHASRSESISSVLGSSIAIQRVLMGNTASASSNTRKSSHRQSVRDIANAFENAAKTTGTTPVAPKKLFSTSLGRVDEVAAFTNNDGNNKTVQNASAQSLPTVSTQSINSYITRNSNARSTVPSRLKITRQPGKGPLSAPATISTECSQANLRDSAEANTQFVFPPRGSAQRRWPYDESNPRARSFISLDDDCHDEDDLGAVFDIIPSPSRTRSPLPRAAMPMQSTQEDPIRASISTDVNSMSANLLSPSLSAAASRRESIDSCYSSDSLSGCPFSLQLPDRGNRPSSDASFLELDEMDQFKNLFLGSSSSSSSSSNHSVDFVNPRAEPREPINAESEACQRVQISSANPTTVGAATVAVERNRASPRASTSALHPLILSKSRPSSSSSSTSTLTPSTSKTTEAAWKSMRINNETSFPLPPVTQGKPSFSDRFGLFKNKPADTLTDGTKARDIVPSARDALNLGSENGADQSLAIAELKREAQALLESIKYLGEEMDTLIPSTHRLSGTGHGPNDVKNNNDKVFKPDSSNRSVEEGDAKVTTFVAVDQSYSDVWRLMDNWYWSSFQVGTGIATCSTL